MSSEIQSLREENESLHASSAEMESDLRTVARVFMDLLSEMNIDPSVFKGGQDMRLVLPGILGSVSRQLLTGGIDADKIANISAIGPILNKYKHLLEDIIPPTT